MVRQKAIHDLFAITVGAVFMLVTASAAHADSESAKLLPSDGAAGDFFGFSVSVSGDIAVVGAHFDDDQTGSAYVFGRNVGGADNWGEVRKLIAADPGVGDNFGGSVSVSGDIAVVSAAQDDDNGGDSGSVYVFARNVGGADNWGQVKKLTPSDPAPSDAFGVMVSVSGDIAVVGARFDDDACPADPDCNSGSAYVFGRNVGGADNWGQVKKLIPDDGAAGDLFGRSVSVSGAIAVVGASLDDDDGVDSGSAYVFGRDVGGADNWGQVRKLTASDGAAFDEFGFPVSVSGDVAVVGARFDDDACPADPDCDSGSVYVFGRNVGGADNWGQVKKLTSRRFISRRPGGRVGRF